MAECLLFETYSKDIDPSPEQLKKAKTLTDKLFEREYWGLSTVKGLPHFNSIFHFYIPENVR